RKDSTPGPCGGGCTTPTMLIGYDRYEEDALGSDRVRRAHRACRWRLLWRRQVDADVAPAGVGSHGAGRRHAPDRGRVRECCGLPAEACTPGFRVLALVDGIRLRSVRLAPGRAVREATQQPQVGDVLS